mmetsp:Transcript_5761/g.10860  ORF Transcript_5761/g.10860 Transcript_5761/m.10860 type:complete len:145 (-) Transcript_5761:1031-1465(-)
MGSSWLIGPELMPTGYSPPCLQSVQNQSTIVLICQRNLGFYEFFVSIMQKVRQVAEGCRSRFNIRERPFGIDVILVRLDIYAVFTNVLGAGYDRNDTFSAVVRCRQTHPMIPASAGNIGPFAAEPQPLGPGNHPSQARKVIGAI